MLFEVNGLMDIMAAHTSKFNVFGHGEPLFDHFDCIEGGRKRVSDIFTHRNSGSCILRSTTTVSCVILASKQCLRRFFPVFDETGCGRRLGVPA